MPAISYKPIEHKNENRILVFFEPNTDWNNRIKKVPGCKWSKTYKAWHIPDNEENRLTCGIANKQSTQAKEINDCIKTVAQQPGTHAALPKSLKQSFTQINPQNLIELKACDKLLVLKGYSKNTIRTYLNELAQFFAAIKDKEAILISVSRVKDYLYYCHKTLELSEATIHSRMNALKFYYEQVLKREKFFWEIPRPKKPMQLPKLLNETELVKLFNALSNKKHKAMLFTAYSAGLRVSEIVSLKISHIDSKRMQILIERAKGKKDRYVNLSPVLLDILRKYIIEYNPKPKEWLFESEQTGSFYPARTVQQIFMNAKKKAGIKKEVGIHSLRHSFATHLLDKGTDIKYIKDLLGHFDIKTTERYLHVSKKQLVNIISPFDDLMQKEQIDW